jgi:rhamnose transport system ATP-binding protein
VRSMVGRDLEPRAGTAGGAGIGGSPLLTVEQLTRLPGFERVSFTVREGEIVGLFGLVGSGRSELVETLFGLHRPDGGRIVFRGEPLRLASPIEAVRAGIVLAPEERHRQGLFFNLSVKDNLLLPGENARGSWRINARAESERSQALLQKWRIKAAGIDAVPESLSGGNQQKVVLAKWFSTEPHLLMLDEPTKGVDVGAKYEIHEFIRNQAGRGMGCLLVSSELPEILALAHRVLVLREGRIQGEVDAESASEETIMRLATAVRH